MPNVFDGDMIVRGKLIASGFTPGNDSIGSTQFNAGDPLVASKQEHQYRVGLAQPHGTAAASERRAVHLAHAAGKVVEVRAGLTVANVGAATVTVDVRKNGTTILSAAISLTSATAAFGSVIALPAVGQDAYAAGDVLEAVVTATAGGGTLGQGLYVGLTLREAAQ